MSKFFIHFLLSMFVGIGAFVGFRSDLRAEVKGSLHQANAMMQTTTNAAFQSVSNVMSQVTASVSARLNANASTEDAKATVKTKGNVEIQTSNGSSLIESTSPELSVDGSSSLNFQSNATVNTSGAQLDLKNKTKSTLDLSLETLK